MKVRSGVSRPSRATGGRWFLLSRVSAAFRTFAAAILWSVAAHAAPTTDFLLQPAEGGAKTRLSWSFGSDWLAPSNVVSASGMAYVGTFGFQAVTPTFVSGTFAVSGAGSYNNLTTGSSFAITELLFEKYGESDLLIGLQAATSPVAGASQQLRYTPGTDSYVVDIPFSSFVSGTYTFNNTLATNPVNVQTLSIVSVPEPGSSTMALAGLVCGGHAMWRHRSRTSKRIAGR